MPATAARGCATTELTSQLDDELYALNERLGEGTFPKQAQDYLADWSRGGLAAQVLPGRLGGGALRRRPAAEKALRWIRSLGSSRHGWATREDVGTL